MCEWISGCPDTPIDWTEAGGRTTGWDTAPGSVPGDEVEDRKTGKANFSSFAEDRAGEGL